MDPNDFQGAPPLIDFKAAIRRLDKRVERLVAYGTPRRLRPLVGLGLVALLAFVTAVNLYGPLGLGHDLFFFPVVYACFFFFARGMWIIPFCLVLMDLRYVHLMPQALPRVWEWSSISGLLVQDLVHAVEWLAIGTFTVVTLSKYVETRRYQAIVSQEVALARTLQRALMPRYFESPQVRVDARIHQTHQIGGDFFYFRPFKEKYVVISLGDIMGKGIPASMVMAIVMGFFYEWGKSSFSPAWILEHLNERLYALWTEDESWFLTMFYAIYDEETHELVYSSGGHQSALLVHEDDALPFEYLTAEGLPIGIFEDTHWQEKRVTLRPGDRVVVFTDGINEARNVKGEIFTMERLQEVVRAVRHLPPGDIARTVVKRVRDWAGGDNLSDDLAILVMEVKQ